MNDPRLVLPDLVRQSKQADFTWESLRPGIEMHRIYGTDPTNFVPKLATVLDYVSPPDRAHDWILHVVREGRVEGMNKSYKFESRDIVLQDVESNSPKVPFTVEQPAADLHVRVSPPFAAAAEQVELR